MNSLKTSAKRLEAGFADEVCTFAALTMIERRRAGNNREYRRNLKWMTGRNVGKTCRTHYRGTFNDGTQFDSSYDRGEPWSSYAVPDR